MAWVRFPDGSRCRVKRVSKADGQRDLDELLALRAADEEAPAKRQRLASLGELVDVWLDADCPTAAPSKGTRHAKQKSQNTGSVCRTTTAKPPGTPWLLHRVQG